MWGNNRPGAIRYLITIHLFCPVKTNSRSLRQSAAQALIACGCTYPVIVNVGTDRSASVMTSGMDAQHWAIECEYIGGVDRGTV